LAAAAVGFVASACPSSPLPAPPAKPEPQLQLVTATVVTNGCATLGSVNARLAEDAMHKLVEGCGAVPGGATQFSVTLLPGGRIELPQGPNQPEVIPTCVFKNELRHRVYLVKPCSLDIKLAESSVPLPPVAALDGGADARAR
jgi:hypothetical protein